METENATRECPYCKEKIKAGATKCRYCGSSLPPESPVQGSAHHCHDGTHESNDQIIRDLDLPADLLKVGDSSSAGLSSRAFIGRLGWRIPIGPIIIGSQGPDCIFIDNTEARIFCVICRTLTSCHSY